ncbi:NF038143 family protein [bacterium]|nr:NF038143 family protein [bacterium]
MMNNPSLEDKKALIMGNEERMANQLARKVIEKPVPPVWMILIPIFFIFFVWKLKQYSRGLKDFATHYLLSKRRALDTAFESVLSDNLPEIDHLVEMAGSLPAKAQPLYRAWLSLLVDHYRFLLTAPGNNHHEFIRSHYQHKINYAAFCNQLNRAEYAYNVALLPGIEGDQGDLQVILDRMRNGIKDLSQKEIADIFG